MSSDRAIALLEPVSPEAPCGPDLDASGDADFANFLATVEGQLPVTFYGFDPTTIDFDETIAQGRALLRRSWDVRLLVMLAKLGALRRDLRAFTDWIEALARTFEQHWEEVNPRAEDGDYVFRMAALYTLDDTAPVLLPLQHTPLVETPRSGNVTWRAHLVAIGEAKAREGEHLPDAGAIDKALQDADLEVLVGAQTTLRRLKTALASIRNVSVEHAGYDQAVKLELLPPLVDAMLGFVQGAVARRDPSQAEAPVSDGPADVDAAPAPASARGRLSAATAGSMLDAVIAYFESEEPSSPAILLVRQARNLVGKNLLEVMRILVPAHAEAARIHVGGEPAFAVGIAGLSGAAGAVAGSTDLVVAPVRTRAAAVALIDEVAGHYRVAEPSSPIPLLLDRAKALSSRDFLALLKELLPESVVKTMKIGG